MFGPCMRSFGAHAAVKSGVRLARSRWRGPCVAASARRPFSPPGTRSTSSVRVWSAENLCAVGFVVGEAAAELARRVAQRHAVLPRRARPARRAATPRPGAVGRARPARRAATRSLDPFVHCFDRRLFIFCTVFRIEASRSFGIRHAPTDTLGATRACQGGARQCTGQDTIGDGAAAEAGMGHWGFDSRRDGHAPRRGSRGQDHAVEAPARHARVISLAALLRVHGGKEGKEMWERY